MPPKLSLKQKSSAFSIIWPHIKNLIILCLIGAFIYFICAIPKNTSIDFAIMRQSLSNFGVRQREIANSQGIYPRNLTASAALQLELAEQAERNKYVNESRARMFVESATNDYYHGDYEESLRRLERAKLYDPCNFSIFRLSGQIFFEKNQYRKAFNDLERANSLPNDDKTIARDLDVLRKLLRYSRSEIDSLRHIVHKEPENKIAGARLKELEERVEN